MRGRLLSGAFLSVVLTASSTSAQPVSLESMLDRASTYVGDLVRHLSRVVADETYVQDVHRQTNGPSPGNVRHRELKADLMLVKLPRTLEWLPFRDVYEVDGKAVRNRGERLSALFLQSEATAVEQATRISEESARYNIGAMQRTINNPMMALVFLQRDDRDRFEFQLGDQDADVGPDVWVVEYRETARPSFIRGAHHADMPAHGRFWIERETGRIVKTELLLEDVEVRAAIATTFTPDERFQVNVPAEMRERYTMRGGQVIATATYSEFRSFTVNAHAASAPDPRSVVDEATGMALVEVPKGHFTMGSAWADAGRHDDEVPHEVEIDEALFLGRFEVTQAEWQAVMGGNPSRFAGCGPGCPVENVSFDDAQRFIAKLNAKGGRFRYRLPSEAEWEYACHAGGTAPFSTGSSLTTSEANYNGTLAFTPRGPGVFREHPTPVGTFPSNAWGLADMHGNVLEWTSDWYADYLTNKARNPRGPASGKLRVVRGGSWFLDVGDARCATRRTQTPSDGTFQIGLRLAASPR